MNETKQDGQGNILEEIIDNGDGTGVRRVFDLEGNVTLEEEVERPLPESEEELKQIPQAALATLAQKLNDPSVNSIAEVKGALKDFIEEIK